MSDTLRIREATAEDIPQILGVLRAALGEPPGLKRTPELFRWKHNVNPFGESIVLVAEEGGGIVGVRAFMRWELQTPTGHTIRCVRAVDTATHPDHARKGIFKRLTLEAVDLARDDGVHLIFNTPNAKSGAGYLKMGWSEVGWTGVMVRPRIGKAVGVKEGEAPTLPTALPNVPRVGDLDLADRPAVGLRTPRTAGYLRWRFNSHPTARYGWVEDATGGAVARVSARSGRSETVLSDLLGGSGSAAVRRLARRSRSQYVATWFTPGSPERRMAMMAGVLPVPRIRTLRIVANPLVDLDTDVSDLASWDLATSDLELL